MTTRRLLTTVDMVRANIPEKYWTASFKQVPDGAGYLPPVRTYTRALGDFLPNGEGLYLYSERNGTGKTALATLVLRRALSEGYTGYYIRSEAIKKAAASQNWMFDEGTTVDERIRAVDLLVIDDFGKEYRTESRFIETVVEDLIRERVQRNRALVITSNLPPALIQGAFSGDLADVLRESCAVVEVGGPEAGGKNWRAEKGERLMDRLYGA